MTQLSFANAKSLIDVIVFSSRNRQSCLSPGSNALNESENVRNYMNDKNRMKDQDNKPNNNRDIKNPQVDANKKDKKNNPAPHLTDSNRNKTDTNADRSQHGRQ